MNLFEEAIADAKKIREAAMANAQNLILEQYSKNVDEKIKCLLNEEEERIVTEEFSMKGGESNTDPIPPSFGEGNKICDCPDDNEEIEINLDGLMKLAQSESPGEMGGMGDMPSSGDLAGDMASPEGLKGLPPDAEGEEEIPGPGKDDEEEPGIVPLKEGNDEEELGSLKLSDDERESISNSDEEELEISEAMLEELVVDLNADRSGYSASPEGERKEKEEKSLAHMNDTEEKERIEDFEKTVKDKDALIKNLREEKAKLRDVLFQLNETVKKTNVLNTKLHYANRVLNLSSLNERQKKSIVEKIENAKNIDEVKVIYETSIGTMGNVDRKQNNPKSLSEAAQRGKTGSILREEQNKENGILGHDFNRMKQLAGIK